MIIKGGARAKGKELATHLLRTDTNESVRILDVDGVAASDLRGAIKEMEAVAAGSRATKPLYHVSISPEAHERLTDEQWIKAADGLGAALGLDGHQRAIVLHEKKGRQHAHVVWNRIDAETLKAAHHGHNYRTHEEVGRALEREFGLNRTQGVHAERDGEPFVRRRLKTKETQQEQRTGWLKSDAVEVIATAWAKAENGQEFQSTLADRGYQLARGDRRDFVVVDPAGGPHSIRSAVRGLRVAEIRERFSDLDVAQLPTVASAKGAALERAQHGKAEAQSPAAASPIGQTARAPDLGDPREDKRPSRRTGPPLPAAAAATGPSGTIRADPPRPVRPGTGLPSNEDRQREEMARLVAQQTEIWNTSVSRMDFRHEVALSAMGANHQADNAKSSAAFERRLAVLDGRVGYLRAPADRVAHDRRVAELKAEQERRTAEEKARQQRVMDALREAQAREKAAAATRHQQLAQQQRAALEQRQQDAETARRARLTGPRL